MAAAERAVRGPCVAACPLGQGWPRIGRPSIGSLDDIVAPYGMGRLLVTTTHGHDVAANWKGVVVDNQQECYHCSMIHPELCRVTSLTGVEKLDAAGCCLGR